MLLWFTPALPYLCAALVTVGALFFLYPFHIALPYFDTDFVDYCVATATFDEADRLFPPKRRKLAGLLSWSGAHFGGVLRGIALGSACSFVATALLLFHWGKTYATGIAWLCLAVFLSLGPAVASGRMLNFYPEITLCLTLAAFFTDLAIRRQKTRHFLLAGIGVSLCFLCDARGLIWGAWFFILLMSTGAISTSKWKNGSALIFPVWMSWFVGWWNTHAYAASFIRQVDRRPLIEAIAPSAQTAPPYEYPSEFIWGYGNPLDIPSNLLFLWDQHQYTFPQNALPVTSTYWMFFALAIVSCAAWLLWRDRTNARLLVVLLPFALSYWAIGEMVEPHIRFYTQSLPVFSILFAVSLYPVVNRYKLLYLACLLSLPTLGAVLAPEWVVSREISTKLLQQAFPNEPDLQNIPLRSGEGLLIQTLPLRDIERSIANDWDFVCSTALQNDGVWTIYP